MKVLKPLNRLIKLLVNLIYSNEKTLRYWLRAFRKMHVLANRARLNSSLDRVYLNIRKMVIVDIVAKTQAKFKKARMVDGNRGDKIPAGRLG